MFCSIIILTDLNLFGFGFFCVSLGDMPVFYHLVKYDIPALFGGFWVFHGIIVVGAFGNRCQGSGFRQADVLDVFPEICQRCGFHTVRTFPEVNLVQVHIQDLVFGILVFHLPGKERFLYLTGNGTFLCKERIFCQLLGDGTAALYFFPFEVTDKSAEGTAIIDTAVFIEPVIFNRYESGPDMFGNLIQLYRKPVLG